jgi:aryl-alcohol dehydrogenase-like predicted oxidoreductase
MAAAANNIHKKNNVHMNIIALNGIYVTILYKNMPKYTDYQNDKGWAVVDALIDIAKAHNSSPSAVALAWLRANPAVSTPIASARTVEQLHEIIEIVNLSDVEVNILNRASA